MREIKFRVWDRIGKSWVGWGSGATLDLRYSGPIGAFMFDNDSYDIPPNAEWCQFTGLRDKSGKEIYEGDIVLGRWGEDGVDRHEPVEWCDTYCGFTPFASYDSDCDMYFDAKRCAVAGNIYENGGLLNGGAR